MGNVICNMCHKQNFCKNKDWYFPGKWAMDMHRNLKGKKNQFKKHLKRMKVGGLQYQILKHNSETNQWCKLR